MRSREMHNARCLMTCGAAVDSIEHGVSITRALKPGVDVTCDNF